MLERVSFVYNDSFMMGFNRSGDGLIICIYYTQDDLIICTTHITHRKPVSCGSVVRLQHLQTRLFLHSHKFSSPLSGNQEVSCFGDGTAGDTGTYIHIVYLL